MNSGGIIVAYKLENIDIDSIKTANKVRDFLDNDFQTYINRGGLHRTDLSSPQLDPAGGAHSGGNSAEDKMMRIFDYRAKCAAIYKAMMDCTEGRYKHRTIMIDCYINELENWQVADKLGVSLRQFNNKKKAALCEFAERLPVQEFNFKTHLRNLIVYSNKEKVNGNHNDCKR